MTDGVERCPDARACTLLLPNVWLIVDSQERPCRAGQDGKRCPEADAHVPEEAGYGITNKDPTEAFEDVSSEPQDQTII